MALKPCRECDQEISTEAESCPNCGAADPTVEGWVKCPKCGSTRTKRLSGWAVAGGSLAGAGCALWIPVIGWILIPVLLLVALFAAILAMVPTSDVQVYCASCKAISSVVKEELPES